MTDETMEIVERLRRIASHALGPRLVDTCGRAADEIERLSAEVKTYRQCSCHGGLPQTEKHYVTFLSPGSFVAETSTREIDSWDVDVAVRMVTGITERYHATPYGFYFTTRTRGEHDFEPEETARSGMYYIGCEVKTVADLEGDPANDILLSNMRSNGWDEVVQTTNGWRWTQPLETGDVVL